MSSKLAMDFGDVYQDDYRKVISKWSKKLLTTNKINGKAKREWGADLQDSLGQSIIDGLTDHTLLKWKKVGKLPSEEVLDLYAKIAAKGSLAADTGDLLTRLKDSVSATEFALQVPEIAKRASQTVSQIFDMAQDRFDGLLNKYFRKKGELSGKRRWVTVPSKFGPSRHAALDGVVKKEDELFSIGGEEVYGPRPPGGKPAQWSNCSCFLSYL